MEHLPADHHLPLAYQLARVLPELCIRKTGKGSPRREAPAGRLPPAGTLPASRYPAGFPSPSFSSASTGLLFSIERSNFVRFDEIEVQFPEITPHTPKVTPAGGPRKACNDAGLRVYPTTGDSQTGINRPPVIPAWEIPQIRFPSRVAGRCGLAGGAFRPPAFILLAFRPAQIAPNRL